MAEKRRRIWITETPPVKAALDPLRAAGVDFSLADLIVRGGAEARLAELDAADREDPPSRGSVSFDFAADTLRRDRER